MHSEACKGRLFIREVDMCACVCVCLYVSVPQAIMSHLHEIKSYCFQFLYVTLAVDISDGRDLINEERREFLPM